MGWPSHVSVSWRVVLTFGAQVIGDGLVAVTVVRNTFSTIFIFCLTPWEDAIGLKHVLVTILLIGCAILAFFGLFIRHGKAFRARSAERYQYYALRQYKDRASE
jgi:hypothetical protein